VVTVQPSSVVVVFSVAGAEVGVRVVAPGAGVPGRGVALRDRDGDFGVADGVAPGFEADGLAEGAGADGCELGATSPESRNCSTETRALSSGIAVRSTGSSATEASATLVRVAAHQPSTGTQVRGDRTDHVYTHRPAGQVHRPGKLGPWL
jgi:hypothetical protein